jgi:glycosyltransferase involved in cell wall biosynthesis
MPAEKPIRVLHLHSDLQWGGVEQWLLHVSRSIDRSAFQFDFFAASLDPHWQSAMQLMGLGMIRSPRPRQLLQYAASLRRVLWTRPRYDVVHSHFTDHTGILLREARRAGVTVRIAHSHIDSAPILRDMPPHRRAYFEVQKKLINHYATRGIAASGAAASSMFGAAWSGDRRWSVLPCGIDLAPFEQPQGRLRSSLGYLPDDIVFGHVGRFAEQKNHRFLIEVAQRLSSLVPQAQFLWVGEGPLQEAVEERLRAIGLRDRVTILSRCDNVPELMRDAMDAFLFPSLYEGLGLAVVEAQAAALPCFISDRVPAEADVVPQLIQRLPLERNASEWAAAISAGLRSNTRVSAQQALETVRRSPFNIETSANRLAEVYCGRG